MKVKCTFNTGIGFSEYTMSHMGCSINTKLPLVVGNEYIVYGQMIHRGILKYLIKGTQENLPSWYPAEIFEVIDSQLHFECYFCYNNNEDISAIWGFEELVNDKGFLYDLIDRKKEAINIFLKRKKEIDEFIAESL